MSDYDKRKKKYYTSPKEKDPVMRRPVILAKSDRDVEREKDRQQREKVTVVEKEKQPVILIKTREQSAAKDSENRPQSPKKSSETDVEIETQIIHPTKIAQNENKEKKKLPEINPLVSPPPMSHPLKLIDESYEFIPTVADYLQDSNTGFLVVGVIGTQGVGKSTILNILAHDNDMTHISEKILKSHIEENTHIESERGSSSPGFGTLYKTLEEDMKTLEITSTNKKEGKPLAFKCQSTDQIERGEPCTTGVDIYVTGTRVILLDASACGGCGLSRLGVGGGVAGAGGARGVGGGSGLEAAALLLAVCHVVILVQDWFTDVNMLRFIQSAEMVKPAVPAASNPTPAHPASGSTTSSGIETGDNQVHREYYPHLLFIQNKCNSEDFRPSAVKMMQDLYRKAFRKSKIHIESGMYMYESDSNDDSHSINGIYHNLNANRCGKPINLFLMPVVEEENEKADTFRGHPSVEELANRLRWQVFGVTRNQLTNVQLTERSWLQYCSKAWDNIRKSTFFIEYGRLLP